MEARMRTAPKSASIVKRSGGRLERRTTVYFEPKKYKRMRLFCVEHDLVMSDLIESAVDLYLDGRQVRRGLRPRAVALLKAFGRSKLAPALTYLEARVRFSGLSPESLKFLGGEQKCPRRSSASGR